MNRGEGSSVDPPELLSSSSSSGNSSGSQPLSLNAACGSKLENGSKQRLNVNQIDRIVKGIETLAVNHKNEHLDIPQGQNPQKRSEASPSSLHQNSGMSPFTDSGQGQRNGHQDQPPQPQGAAYNICNVGPVNTTTFIGFQQNFGR